VCQDATSVVLQDADNKDRASAPGQCVTEPILRIILLLLLCLATVPVLCSQTPSTASGPIAVVPLDSKNPDKGPSVTGALEISQGKAIIAASGAVTSGSETTQVILPHRGVLRVCASTTVKLATDASVPAGETPGLLIAMDHGAIEASFATGRNSDILLTPDFRILIGGPGAAEVRVRLGQHGDTCVDNARVTQSGVALPPNAEADGPYVLVSSVFDGGAYRVQVGQRVMFQHGSLHEVVDNEKEPCGCPPATTQSNEFPLAQSEGLAPLAKPAQGVTQAYGASEQSNEALVYNSADHAANPVEAAAAPGAPTGAASPASPAPAKKPSFFTRVGRLFKRIFGAE